MFLIIIIINNFIIKGIFKNTEKKFDNLNTEFVNTNSPVCNFIDDNFFLVAGFTLIYVFLTPFVFTLIKSDSLYYNKIGKPVSSNTISIVEDLMNNSLKDIFNYDSVFFFNNTYAVLSNINFYNFLIWWSDNVLDQNLKSYILSNCSLEVRNEIFLLIDSLSKNISFNNFKKLQISPKALVQFVNLIKFNGLNT